MNILILGGKSYVASANLICVKNMAREFASQGDNVWIIVSGREDSINDEEIDGYHQIQIKRNWYQTFHEAYSKKGLSIWKYIYLLISYFRYLFMMPFYPNVSPFTAKRQYRHVRKMVADKKIEMVIGTYGDYENIYTAVKIKRQFKKVKVALYYLDLCTASDNSLALIRKFTQNRMDRTIIRQSKIVDKIVIPFSGKTSIERLKGVVRNRIEYVGFPVYLPFPKDTYKCEAPFNDERIDLIYIGSLSLQNRDPEYILNVMEEAAHKIDRQLMIHFWGNVSDKTILTKIESSPICKYYGYVDNKYTQHLMKNCDYIINIGNMLSSEMLPSKLFSIFPSGKPIINVINNPNDASLAYLKLYGNSMNIMAYKQEIEHDVNRVCEVFKQKETISIKTKDEVFKEFTPRYICGVFKSC